MPSSLGQLQFSFAPIVQRVAPAVVNVYATHIVENQNPFLSDPFFRQFFGGGTPGKQVERSLGSGVIVDPSGLVVTNYHVIRGASEVRVALADKREFDADIVLKDQRSDLAVLRIKGAHERFPVLEFANSDALQVGDVVLAIGDPFGVGQTVTHGIVSALARTQVGTSDYQFFIQTDAADQSRQFRRRAGRHERPAGRHQQRDRLVVRRLGGHRLCHPGQHGACGRGFGGSRQQRGQPAVARRQAAGGHARHRRQPRAAARRPARWSRASPPAVRRRAPESSPATCLSASTALAVEDPNAFDYRFATKPLGGTAQIGLIRQGQQMVVPVALQPLPETPRDEVEIRSASPFRGATVANLSPALADELRLDPEAQGVVVTAVADGSTAQSIGFRPGDIVISVNSQKIEQSADLERIANSGSRSWRITIRRGDQQISVMFGG